MRVSERRRANGNHLRRLQVAWPGNAVIADGAYGSGTERVAAYDRARNGDNREGAGGTDVLCVFLDAPLEDSTGSIRWRQLASVACGLGKATVVVVHELEPDAQVWLAERLGARVVGLGVTRSGRTTAIARGLTRPRRSWPPTKTDVAAAAKRDRPRTWQGSAERRVVRRRRGVVGAAPRAARARQWSTSSTCRAATGGSWRGSPRTGSGGGSPTTAAWRRASSGSPATYRAASATGGSSGVLPSAPQAWPWPARPSSGTGFHCVRTGVDDPGPVQPLTDPYAVPHFVFFGSFLYPPHQDAAEWFALYVLPPLRRLLPACRVVFAGPCPDWMFSFGRLHDIEVSGRLDDAGTVLDGRCVVIAPIRAGSGTVIEVVEAWARRVPVVSTSRGVEGLDAHDGDDVLVADDPAEFAAQCSMAARYPELRDKLTANGRVRYEAEFTWPLIGAELADWLTEAPAH